MNWSGALADNLAAGDVLRFGETHPNTLLCVVGPTASGKSDLAAALAQRFDGEIISADSVQVYRGFDVGSAKPSRDERARVPHHVIDVADPLEHIDARRFVDLADLAITDCVSRGKRPIVCGGTFLWVKALLFGLAGAPPGDAAIRAKHRELANAQGNTRLHDMLRNVDPESAERLHPNDLVRVSRALEVHELSGRTLSSWQAAHRFETARHDAKLIGVMRSPDDLTIRIQQRVDAWLSGMLIEEVRTLIANGFGEARAMGSVGYREVKKYLEGQLPQPQLAEEMVRATRVFARRQRTWLNSEDVMWIRE